MMTMMNTRRGSNTGRGSDVIVLIGAGGFYSRKYGISQRYHHTLKWRINRNPFHTCVAGFVILVFYKVMQRRV